MIRILWKLFKAEYNMGNWQLHLENIVRGVALSGSIMQFSLCPICTNMPPVYDWIEKWPPWCFIYGYHIACHNDRTWNELYYTDWWWMKYLFEVWKLAVGWLEAEIQAVQYEDFLFRGSILVSVIGAGIFLTEASDYFSQIRHTLFIRHFCVTYVEVILHQLCHMTGFQLFVWLNRDGCHMWGWKCSLFRNTWFHSLWGVHDFTHS